MLTLDTEVLALRERLGASYKDASHRLYMAEYEKLKADSRAQKTFAGLTHQVTGALERFQKKLEAIDSGRSEAQAVNSEMGELADGQHEMDNADEGHQ